MKCVFNVAICVCILTGTLVSDAHATCKKKQALAQGVRTAAAATVQPTNAEDDAQLLLCVKKAVAKVRHSKKISKKVTLAIRDCFDAYAPETCD